MSLIARCSVVRAAKFGLVLVMVLYPVRAFSAPPRRNFRTAPATTAVVGRGGAAAAAGARGLLKNTQFVPPVRRRQQQQQQQQQQRQQQQSHPNNRQSKNHLHHQASRSRYANDFTNSTVYRLVDPPSITIEYDEDKQKLRYMSLSKTAVLDEEDRVPTSTSTADSRQRRTTMQSLRLRQQPNAMFRIKRFVGGNADRRNRKATTVRQQQAENQRGSNRNNSNIPDVKKVLRFAVPAIGVWMYMPLLSMMDTSSVGLLAGTAQQAALNPAVAVINYSAKLLCFLYTGSTTLIAAAKEADRGKYNQPQTTKTFVGALQLSMYVGLGLGTLLFVFAEPFLCAIVGKSGAAIDPAVLGPAKQYVRYRALAMPAAAILGSIQTAQLGLRDVVSPVTPTVVAACVNYVANNILVRQLGGAAGAGCATLIAQYVALAVSLRWLLASTTKNNNGQRQQQQKDRNNPSTRGFLAGRARLRDIFRLPTRETSKGFAPYVIPVSTTQVGRASASATLDHVVSSSLGTVNLAANQIITSVFYGLVPLADSLSLAAQSFVPGIAERKPSREKAQSLLQLYQSFLKAALLCGAVLAAVTVSMPLGLTNIFTSDPAVIRAVSAVIPIHFIMSCVHGIFCASEGLLLGQKDLTFIGRMYGVFTFLIPYLLLRVKRAALSGTQSVSLSSVWNVFLGYEIARISIMVSRTIWLQRKSSGRTSQRTRRRSNVSFQAG